MLPFLAALAGCIVATAAVCLQVLALQDAARTTARLASVAADPGAAADQWVRLTMRTAIVEVSTTSATVTVRLRRRYWLPVPFVGRVPLPAPLHASATMPLEPPQ